MKPIVKIEHNAYQKVMHWVNKSDFEVSGFGIIKEVKGNFVVTDAILLEQTNTTVTTELEASDILKAMRDYANVDGKMRWWWHSHVKMEAFWSGTDTDTIEGLGEHGYFVATVFNQHQKMRSAMRVGVPFNAFIDDLPTEIVMPVHPDVAEWDRLYAEKVTNETPSQYVYNAHKGTGLKPSYPSYGRDWNDDVWDSEDIAEEQRFSVLETKLEVSGELSDKEWAEYSDLANMDGSYNPNGAKWK